MLEKNIHTFIGADKGYKESDICIYGCPFDGTTSYRPGARFAPSFIRNESYGIETYSPYQNLDLTDFSFFDGGDLEIPFGNTQKVLDMTKEYALKILRDKKLPFLIGGEHLVTLAQVRACTEIYSDLHIIHFDAHCDLRDEYMGEKLSHATVMRRCYELVGENRIFQFGIRSGAKAEFEFASGKVFMNKFDLSTLYDVVDKLKDKNVYFSIDLDVLDPSEFPGTGTPEAGGISFSELMDGVMKVCKLNIVAADVCELSPTYDASGRSTVLACKLVREILLALKSK